MKLLVQGVSNADEIPGLLPLPEQISTVFAPDEETLKQEMPGTEIILSWDFRGNELQPLWQYTTDLKWIHWCGAGVDVALFDELRNSDVSLTNARGIFDRAMAETVLGYLLYQAKDFETTRIHQEKQLWEYRMTHQVKGDRALVVGVGSIGREIARLLGAMEIKVSGAGRSERRMDPDFDMIYASRDILTVLPEFDWVIGVMPSTESTMGFFDASFFSAMKETGCFVNVGRGSAVVEPDLIRALQQGRIAGAMLDVFENEPLQPDDPVWDVPNLFVSPHISGDFIGFEADLVKLFRDNLDRYLNGESLYNLVDKRLGFVKSE